MEFKLQAVIWEMKKPIAPVFYDLVEMQRFRSTYPRIALLSGQIPQRPTQMARLYSALKRNLPR